MKLASVLLGLLLTLCVCPPAAAQSSLDARISMSFDHGQPAAVFTFLAQNLKLEPRVDAALQGSLTLTLQDVKVRTLLDAICDSLGCRWRIDGTALVVEAQPPDPSRGRTWIQPPRAVVMPAGSRFEKTSVRSVLDAIGRAVGDGSDYEVDGIDSTRLVTVDVSNQESLSAIAMVVKAAGLAPGSPYTVRLHRPGQKLIIIKSTLDKQPEPAALR
jgi:hypothetical protein